MALISLQSTHLKLRQEHSFHNTNLPRNRKLSLSALTALILEATAKVRMVMTKFSIDSWLDSLSLDSTFLR